MSTNHSPYKMCMLRHYTFLHFSSQNLLIVFFILFLNCWVDRTNVTGKAKGTSVNWNMTIASWITSLLIANKCRTILGTSDTTKIRLYEQKRAVISLAFLTLHLFTFQFTKYFDNLFHFVSKLLGRQNKCHRES